VDDVLARGKSGLGLLVAREAPGHEVVNGHRRTLDVASSAHPAGACVGMRNRDHRFRDRTPQAAVPSPHAASRVIFEQSGERP
jgi:hypothetical protein